LSATILPTSNLAVTPAASVPGASEQVLACFSGRIGPHQLDQSRIAYPTDPRDAARRQREPERDRSRCWNSARALFIGEFNELIAWPPLVPSLPLALAMHGTCCTGPVEAVYQREGTLPEFEASIRIKSSHIVPGEDRATFELDQNATVRVPDRVGVQIKGTTMPRDAGANLESIRPRR
jgi:hypothetical protein